MGNIGENPGTQSLQRALGILRLLGESDAYGLRATEVIQLTGLQRSTAHRLLQGLVQEQFIERDAQTRRYRLGQASLKLGLHTLRAASLIPSYQSVVQRLAHLSEDTVFLVARQGNHTVCLHRLDGAFPVKIFSTRVGDVRPIGPGLGGMALLAECGDDEVDAVCRANAQALEAAGLSRSRVDRVIADGRANGYVEMMDTVTQGVGGVSAVFPSADRPFVAVAIAAIAPRMSPARRAELGAMILRELGASRI